MEFCFFTSRDVSFEKRILPSRTQGRERRFLNEDSDCGGDDVVGTGGNDQSEGIRRKDKPSKDVCITIGQRRHRSKGVEEASKKVKRDNKIVGVAAPENAKGEAKEVGNRVRLSERRTGDDKLPGSVCPDGGEGRDVPADESVRLEVESSKKHKSKKTERHREDKPKEKKKKKSKDDDGRKVKVMSGGKDGDNERSAKKKKKISETFVSEEEKEAKGKIKSKHSKTKNTSVSNLYNQISAPTSGPVASGSVSILSPQSPVPSNSAQTPPSITQEPTKVATLITRPSSLPPPSSPDKSPMFDNSDDEFPELVIDVPM